MYLINSYVLNSTSKYVLVLVLLGISLAIVNAGSQPGKGSGNGTLITGMGVAPTGAPPNGCFWCPNPVSEVTHFTLLNVILKLLKKIIFSTVRKILLLSKTSLFLPSAQQLVCLLLKFNRTIYQKISRMYFA